MKLGKIHKFKNGEPYIFEANTIKEHVCCDCGLVHFVHTVEVKGKKALTYWYRDDYQTDKLRKKKKEKK